jgi:hypothetical protein
MVGFPAAAQSPWRAELRATLGLAIVAALVVACFAARERLGLVDVQAAT